jgi:hypothetical protein
VHGTKIGARLQRLNKAPKPSSIRRLPHAVEKRHGGQPVRADDHSLKHFDCLVNPTRLGARFHRPEYLSGPQFAAGRTPTHHRVWHAPALYSSSPEATILVRLPRVATSAILRSAFSRTPCSMQIKRSKQQALLALTYRSTSSTFRPCKGQRPLAVYCNRGRDRSDLEAGLTRDPLQRHALAFVMLHLIASDMSALLKSAIWPAFWTTGPAV